MTAIKCTEDVLAAAEINNNFILAFHAPIRKEVNRNLFYSGLTTSSMLSMMWDSFADKKSNHARLIRTFLHKEDAKEKQITPGFSEILRSYKNLSPGPNDATMKMVNKVYTNSLLGPVTDGFKEKLNEYDCLHETIDCSHGRNNMAEKINDDFGTYTNDKVKDVVSSDQLDADAEIMLISSVSFRGVWEVPFETRLTEVMDFYCLNGRKVKVNMMKKKRAPGFSYTNFAIARAHACAMYFEGFRYCMIVVRPKTNDLNGTESKMIKELQPEVLIAHFKRYHRKSRRGDGGLLVNVSMPRFKILSRHFINKPLKNMKDQPLGSGDERPRHGDIFQTAHGKGARITHIIQKCDIEIDETGAPQGIAVPSLLPARPLWKSRPKCVKMILDRAFYFVLYDYTNNCLIAAGVVDNPLEYEKGEGGGNDDGDDYPGDGNDLPPGGGESHMKQNMLLKSKNTFE